MKKSYLLLAFVTISIFSYGQKYSGLTANASSGNAAFAVDNNVGTRWESESTDPQWIIVDLGEVKPVGAIKLFWENANAKDYSISFSSDGSTFNGDLFYTDKTFGERTDNINDLDISCRYIKMNGTARTSVWGYSIWEFEVYPPVTPELTSLVITPANSTITLGNTQQFTVSGLDQIGNPIVLTNATDWLVDGIGASIDATGLFSSTTKGLYTINATNTSITKTTTIDVIPSNSNLSIGKTATASSGDATAAIDNNGGTRWESASSDPQWIEIDLGSMKFITDIFIVWEGANSKDYFIETSTDETNWTTIITKTNMPNMPRTDRMYDLNILGRYIRLTGTARNLIYGHSIWEFKIFGKTPDLYRSTGSGDWNSSALWETSTDNVNWTPTSIPPPVNTDLINIQSDQSISITENVTTSLLTLQPGAKLTINTGKTLTANSITLNSDATGTATLIDDYNVPTINGSVQQFVEAGRNWYASSPVLAAPYSVLNRGDSVITFNEVTKKWNKITSDNLVQGKGYVQAALVGHGTTGIVNFSGLLNSGNVTLPLSRTGTAQAGFNLVGNPYPSYLDWSKVATANTNVLPTLWFRTKKTTGVGYTFATVNVATPSNPVIVANDANTTITKYIPPMQAYWVRLIENPSTSEFIVTNAMRDHNDIQNNTFKAPKKSEISLLRLLVSNGDNSDETVLYFSTNASNDFDRFDSPKMLNNSPSVPEIYTLAGDEKLVINGLNEIQNDIEIPIGFATGQINNFTLKSTEMSNFEVGTKILLIDKQNPTVETELSEGGEYSFSSQVTTPSTNRFSLIFRAPGTTTDVKNAFKNKVQAFVNQANQIIILAPEKSYYTIYNAVGQKMTNGFATSDKTIINNTFKAGVYVVKVNENGLFYSTKVIIK